MDEREHKLLFRLRDEALDAPAVDEVFQPSLLAVGAVAMLTEDANHRGGNSNGLVGA